MVQISSTFVLATIAILSASSMAITLSQRNQQETRDLEERNWNSLENDVTKVASVFIREDELELEEHSRSSFRPAGWKGIQSVNPKPINFSAQDHQERGIFGIVKKGFKFASNFLREDEQEITARELEEREPSSVKPVNPWHLNPATEYLREDELEFLSRDLDERGFWSSVKKGLGKVVNFAAPIVKNFIREDEQELSAREFEEREDELELLERDLQVEERGFWSSVKKGFGKVVNFAAPIVSKFIREDEQDIAARDYDDLIYAREYLDINELD